MSQFITLEFALKIGLEKEKINFPVSGLSGITTNVKWKSSSIIANRDSSFSSSVDFLIVPKITDLVPATVFNIENFNIPERSALADPTFDKPGKIDMIIGAELFFEIIKEGKLRISSNLMFQNSVFGYIACGSNISKNSNQYCGIISHFENIDDTLKQFWELEEVPAERLLTKEEEYCELHFKRTHKRDATGRYKVQMPIKEEELNSLGDSRALAEKRLKQTHRRLSKCPNAKQLYNNFLAEYEGLKHMEKVSDGDIEPVAYYMPHHGIFKPEKTSTKLRIVFNASAPTTTGRSLNDILLSGEIKEDIFDLMVRFRKHKVVLTADIRQMFRQILIDPAQRDLLRILWNTEENHTPNVYRMNTVTYGTKNAPFLAIRTLKQLALDEASRFPLASEVTLSDVYMDDIVTGVQDLESAQELKHQLIKMFASCGMTLHKWNSNFVELLETNTEDIDGHSFASKIEATSKTLGIAWKSREDEFIYNVSLKEQKSYTKREVLSTIAKLYDPLGLLGPIISKAKIFLQRLWLEKIGWDDTLPESIAREWYRFVNTVKSIEALRIDRYILNPEAQSVLLLGFADASTAAFGAVIYVRCITSDNYSKTRLVTSKSRVSPLKTISIPRLELCACLLLARLTKKVLASLKISFDRVILFSDSTIALAWINSPAHQLKTFVSNRVSKIQSLTENHEWRHVSSSNNPADIISRGIDPEELQSSELWWNGPLTPIEDVSETIENQLDGSNQELFVCELKQPPDINLVVTSNTDFINDLLALSNNYVKLIHILSFIFRFIANCRKREKISGPISKEEFEKAKIFLTQSVQVNAFNKEIKALRNGEMLKDSHVSNLNIFLDKNGLIRVGGRLNNSNFSFDKKHPILLPRDHKLTRLILQHFHQKNLHIGAQSLLHCVRQEFWPLNGRNNARKIIHNCVTCFKNKPKVEQQLMASLPKERVTVSPPFSNCGADLCGPFYVKYKNQRKGILNKIYVCIFVCFSTRAVHLEILTDLTSDALIATLKRFFARRGVSSTIFSDNATNFVGANAELKRLSKLCKNPSHGLASYLASESISWKFLPPRSPNFGGLWEAGVKSFKHHLKRVVGNSNLILEEFLTVTNQIEGILNSRPLIPLSSDPNDFETLTPGHFLIGRPLNSIPEPDVTDLTDNTLSRWQKVTKFNQLIWKSWSRDYLNNLQLRSKWLFEKNIKVGTMVLLKDDRLPVCTWSIGRIQDIIPGNDGKIRVVMVKTPRGIFKRSISSIGVLPINDI